MLSRQLRTESVGSGEGGSVHPQRLQNLLVYVRREVTSRDVLDEEFEQPVVGIRVAELARFVGRSGRRPLRLSRERFSEWRRLLV